MMEADRDKWNAKYRERSGDLPSPESFVEHEVDRLVGSTVLDVACGDGGNALFLAEQGFDVTGVDISEVGLSRLSDFAHERGLDIETYQCDLDREDALAGLGCFDNVIVTRFKPPEAFWEQVEEVLRPGGLLLLGTFSVRQHEEHGFPRRFCLESDELVDVCDGLECVEHIEYGGPDQYLEGYVFRRCK